MVFSAWCILLAKFTEVFRELLGGSNEATEGKKRPPDLSLAEGTFNRANAESAPETVEKNSLSEKI